jgi:hypothetical protein
MMMSWVRLPTGWITRRKGLREFRWTRLEGANNIAALMTLMVIAHHADYDSGVAKRTYDELTAYTELSRAKVSGGLKTLEKQKIVERHPSGRSTFQVIDKISDGWGKLPAQKLYEVHDGPIAFFRELTLRKATELHALKLYYLFVAMRDIKTNMAHISYDRIEFYTAIERARIKSGLSVLAANGLIQIEHLPRNGMEHGYASAYRVAHIDATRHMGTTGRNDVTFQPLAVDALENEIPF